MRIRPCDIGAARHDFFSGFFAHFVVHPNDTDFWHNDMPTRSLCTPWAYYGHEAAVLFAYLHRIETHLDKTLP